MVCLAHRRQPRSLNTVSGACSTAAYCAYINKKCTNNTQTACSLVLFDQCRLYLLSLSISMSNSLIIMLLELFSSSHTTEAYKSIIGIKHSDANFHSLDVFEKAVNSCSAAQNAANGVSGAQTAAQKSENSVWRMQYCSILRIY